MHLFANGCSFTYGAGLWEEIGRPEIHGVHTDPEADAYRMKNSWPCILHEELGFDSYTNHGRGAASMSRIVRTTVQWLAYSVQADRDLSDTVAVIQFTQPARDEYYHSDNYHPVANGKWYIENFPEEDGMRETVVNFIEHFWHPPNLHVQFYLNIIHLQHLFQAHGIPYFFFYGLLPDEDMLARGNTIQSLAKLIDFDRMIPYGTGNPPHSKVMDMLNWCYKYDEVFEAHMHPTSAGHRLWVEKILAPSIREKL